MPYLISVLGIEKFGLIVMAQTIIGYFVLFVDYGFSLSATKEIAEFKENLIKINKIFTSVLIAKLILFIFGLIILHSIIIYFDRFNSDYWIYIMSYGVAFGNVIFPVWYFMGTEKMEYVAIFNILPKAIFLLLLFFVVDTKSDYIYVPIIFSLGFIASGLISLYYSLRLGVSFAPVTFEEVKEQFKTGWQVFIGMLSSSLTSNAIPLFLGIITNNSTLGIYSAVEKLIKPLANISNSLLNVIYPHMVNLKKISHSDAFRFSIKVTTYYIAALSIICIAYYYFAIYFIETFLREESNSMQSILNYLIFLPFFTSFLNLFCISNCLVFSLNKTYSYSLIFVFFASLIISPTLIYFYDIFGASIGYLVIEFLKILLMLPFLYIFITKNNLYRENAS